MRRGGQRAQTDLTEWGLICITTDCLFAYLETFTYRILIRHQSLNNVLVLQGVNQFTFNMH